LTSTPPHPPRRTPTLNPPLSASAADSDAASLASAEGDLWEGLDPGVASESILNAMLGAQLLAKAADGNDHIKRLTRSLELLLPAIVADVSLAYFREFVARESLRHHRPTDPTDRAHQPN
jgi:hypothetical protein